MVLTSEEATKESQDGCRRKLKLDARSLSCFKCVRSLNLWQKIKMTETDQLRIWKR